MFTDADWYWSVAGDSAHVFSSASGTVIATTDAGYQAWLAAGNRPSAIASFAELNDVLAQNPAVWLRALPALEATGDLTPAQMEVERLARGLTIASTANEATLGGTYPIDSVSQGYYEGVADGIANGKGLPGALAVVGIDDVAGATHSFAEADFLNFAFAVETYVNSLIRTRDTLLANGTASWPAMTSTIA